MAATVNVNGRVFDQEHAVISVFDHGFLYGEGVYETWRTYNGQPFLFDRHMRRLRNSSGMIALAVPLTDEQTGRAVPRDDARRRPRRAGRRREAYVRVLSPAASASSPTIRPAALRRRSSSSSSRMSRRRASVYDRGVNVALVPIIRNHPGTVNPLIKSNNLLNNALAMQEAFRRGAFEGVMRNYRGELAECTPVEPVHRQGRRRADAAARRRPAAGHHARVRASRSGPRPGFRSGRPSCTTQDLFGADEAFLTSSTRELVPIVQVDDRRIGTGVPGPVTRALLERFPRAEPQD